MKKVLSIILSVIIYFLFITIVNADSNDIYWAVDGVNCESSESNCNLVISNYDIQGSHFAYGSYNTNSSDVPWSSYKSSISNAIIGGENDIIKPISTALWFSGSRKLESIDLKYLDTSDVINMHGMFAGSGLKDIDLSGFDTSNVKDMSSMFHFSMFTSLDLSNFNTSKVTDISNMFSYSSILMSVDLSNFNTSKVVNMTNVFKDCHNLQIINGGADWNTFNVSGSLGMFENCYSLTGMNGNGYDRRMQDATYAKVGGSGYFWNYMPPQLYWAIGGDYCDKLIITSNVLKGNYCTQGAFMGAKLNSHNNAWNQYREDIVEAQVGTKDDIVAPFDTSSWFIRMKKLEFIDLAYLDTSKVTNMSQMFAASSLKNIDLSKFNTSKVTDMSYMFAEMENIKMLDLSAFDTSSATNMSFMFNNDSNLEIIKVGDNWNISNYEYNNNLFYGCKKIYGMNGTGYNNKYDDVNYHDRDYAKIDEKDNPGYLWNYIDKHNIRFDSSSDNIPTLKYNYDNNTIFLTWDKIDIAVGYYIYKWDNNPNSAYVKIGETTDNYYNDSSLLFDRKYSYKIVAYNNYGVSNYSNVATIYTNPIIIDNLLKIENNGNNIFLSCNINTEFEKIEISRSTDNKKWKIIEEITTNNYNDIGLTYGKTYYYKVRIYNGINWTNYSNIVSKKIVPNKVEGLKVTGVTSTSIKIEWDKGNVTGYELYMNGKKTATISKIGTVTYNKTKLKANTTYKFKVRAYKKVGSKKIYGPFSSEVSIKTAPSTPSITVSNKDYKTLNVKMNSVKGAAKYVLEMSTNKTTYEVLDTLTASGNYAVSDLTAGTTYYFRLKVCNSDNNCSAYSKVMSKNVIPSTPSLSVSSPVTKNVLVKVNPQEGAVRYEIYRSTKKSSGYKMIATLTDEDEVLEYLDTTSKKKTYYYKVRTYVMSGETKVYSSYSSVKKIKSK